MADTFDRMPRFTVTVSDQALALIEQRCRELGITRGAWAAEAISIQAGYEAGIVHAQQILRRLDRIEARLGLPPLK